MRRSSAPPGPDSPFGAWQSNDPIGVELSGVGHIFAEVWRWAEAQGARPESMIGLAGTGDLVATAR